MCIAPVSVITYMLSSNYYKRHKLRKCEAQIITINCPKQIFFIFYRIVTAMKSLWEQLTNTGALVLVPERIIMHRSIISLQCLF